MSRPSGSALLVDTNLLVYAFRPQSPEHGVARDWLTRTLESPGRLALTGAAVVGFVRLVTHRRIFRDAVGIDQALGFVDGLRRARAVSVEPGAVYPDLFRDICRSLALNGDDVPDAHLAAVAMEHDAVIATHDRGFERFPGLRTFDPLA